MSLHEQPLLDIHEKLVIDLFAGGGGASSGIEQATGRMVDIAINHDPVAVSMHEANHPQTRHLVSDIFEVDPRKTCGDRGVALLWASPDCTDHSKAKGAAPIRTRKRRSLAWVVLRWAGTVQPESIFLENVEEFVNWGPLVGKPGEYRRCPKRKGKHFRTFVRSLRQLGYAVEWRELRACDCGAPTIRKRLYLIASRICAPVWPAPTHGAPGSLAVREGRLKQWRCAGECIDFNVPMCSIFASPEEAKAFARKHGVGTPIRPLKEKTLARISRGVRKYVIDNPKPYTRRVKWIDTSAADGGSLASFAAPITHAGKSRGQASSDPLATITGAHRGEHALIGVGLVPRYGERDDQQPRVRSLCDPSPTVVPTGNGGSVVAASLGTYYGDCERVAPLNEPLRTQTTENRHALVAALIGQENGGFYAGGGRPADAPLSTILENGSGHHPVIAAHIQRDFGTSTGSSAESPIGTITADGCGHAGLVASLLLRYNGTGESHDLREAIGAVTSKDRFGLVTCKLGRSRRVIADIYMRMLTPRELYLCQGFRPGYIIDRTAEGKPITKTDQVRMVGNSVSPPVAEAFVRANRPDLIVRTAPRRMVAA